MDVQDGEFLIDVSPKHDGPEPPAPTADIVFVHGLNPLSKPNFARATWTYDDGNFWPVDELGQLLPGSRILLFSYNSRVAWDASTNGIKEHANNLLVRLAEERPLSSEKRRPIVFVAHSLGGLVVKQALVIAKNDDNFKEIRKATTSLVFFAVPHRGGHLAKLGKIAKDIVTAINGEERNDLVESLHTNSLFQEEQTEFFRQQLNDYQIFAVIEARETVLSKKFSRRISKIIVDRQSATLGLPGTKGLTLTLNANHSDVCRIARDSLEFRPVLSRIKKLAEAAIQDKQEVYCDKYRLINKVLKSTRTLKVSAKLYQDCLKSLAFPQMQDRFQDIETAADGTCKWLFRHETYKNWVTCDRGSLWIKGLLWIKGNPGSRKSTLLKYALDNRGTRNSALFLSFFFHGRGNELQKTSLGLFRSLLHQILGQVPNALLDLVDIFTKKRGEFGKVGEKWKWHQRELCYYLQSSLAKVLETRSIYLFVDALDKCGKENAIRIIEDFKSLLKKFSSMSTDLKQFRICFSCRHYPILNLDDAFKIKVEDETKSDISTFVNDRLSAFSARTSSTIPTIVTNRASGIYLWAQLVVKQILDLERSGHGPIEIEKALDSIPLDLDELYKKLIQDMKPVNFKLIQWICLAIRPLSLEELEWAMFIEVDCPYQSLHECKNIGGCEPNNDRMKMRVQTLSCGLAEVISSSGDGDRDPPYRSIPKPFSRQVVQFIHQSVKDFFIQKGLSILDGSSSTTDTVIRMAHSRLSTICIHYLKMEEIGRSTSYMLSDFPFVYYATTSWLAHTKQSDTRSLQPENNPRIFTLASNSFMELWVRVYREIGRIHCHCPLEGTTLIHVLAKYDILDLLKAALPRVDQIDVKDEDGRTPLSYAVIYGHNIIAQLLLDTGKVDVNSKNKYGQALLMLAAREGREIIVQQLLDTHKIDIDSKDNDGQTPFSWAARRGHKDVVQQLLDTNKVNIDSENIWGETPLSRAAELGHETVVQQLLDTGKVNIDSKDKRGETPLSLAAQEEHKIVVQLLKSNGAKF